MKKIGQILTTALAVMIAAALCAGCDREGPDRTDRGTAIRFLLRDMGNSDVASKASVVTTDSFHESFGVYAYMTEGSETRTIYMDNVEMVKKGAEWSPAPNGSDAVIYYWPVHPLTFYAYAPYASATNGIAVTAPEDASADPVLTYTYDLDNQTDLVYTHFGPTTMPEEGRQGLQFRHALSRIEVYVNAKRGSVNISDLSVSGQFHQKGVLDLGSDSWKELEPSEDAYTYTYEAMSVEQTAAGVPARLSGSSGEDANSILVIPTDTDGNFTLRTTYTAGSTKTISRTLTLRRVAPQPGSYVKIMLTYGDNLYLVIYQSSAGGYYNKETDFGKQGDINGTAGGYAKPITLDWSGMSTSAGGYKNGNLYSQEED